MGKLTSRAVSAAVLMLPMFPLPLLAVLSIGRLVAAADPAEKPARLDCLAGGFGTAGEAFALPLPLDLAFGPRDEEDVASDMSFETSDITASASSRSSSK